MAVKLRERQGKGWYVLTDWRGQRKAKFFGADKKAAQAFADKLAARLKWAEQSGEPIALSQPDQAIPTVKAYMEDWIKTYAEVHCKPTTATDYRQSVALHIVPALGERRLHEVTRADIKRLIAVLMTKGLKKQTVHNILTPLKEAYNHAIDDGVVASNPVARTGRFTRSREDQRAHIAPLTTEEVRTLLHTAQQKVPVLYPLLLCAVRTGMREGELIGLQWEDVDFGGQFIEVRRGVVRGAVTSTKSRKIRRVDMTLQLQACLQRLKEIQQLNAMANGQEKAPWVFLSPVGGYRWADQTLRRTFYRCLELAELRRVRFHDLRHTFASLLIQQSANPKYVQEQLGHGSIQVTMDIYGHLFAGDHRHMVSRLDDPQEEASQAGVGMVESATQAQPGAIRELTKAS